MPTIDQLKTKYFVQDADASPPSAPKPMTWAHCKVTPLIDCPSYCAEIEAALAMVGTGATAAANANHFIYIANWWLGLRGGQFVPPPSILSSLGATLQEDAHEEFRLDGPGGTRVLFDILTAKARAGVDVRVLGWVSYAVMDHAIAMRSGAAHIAAVNAKTMESIRDLRAEPTLAKKALLNVIAHSAGAVHNKLVVIGNDTNAIAFTGGIDFDMGRWANPGHVGAQIWHDVVAKVEGPAVQDLYWHFGNLWQANLERPARSFRFEGADLPSYLPGTPTLSVRQLTLAPTGSKHHVQPVRTVPKFNYTFFNCLPEGTPISWAPEGIFEYRLAWKKALKAAESYVYIEDQSYWSQEILSFVNTAIKARPALKVILMMSGGADPNDPAMNDAPYLNASINHGLLEGLTAAQRDQVRVFRRMGDVLPVVDSGGGLVGVQVATATDAGTEALVTLNALAPQDIPANGIAAQNFRLVDPADTTRQWIVVGNPQTAKDQPMVWRVSKGALGVPPTGVYALARQVGILMHSKTVLVDDHWAVIGSGNIMRRSLYTDIEHGVAFIDEDGTAVPSYRSRLWADHFRYPTPADFLDLGAALHAWEPAWGAAGAAPPRHPLIVPVPVPVQEVAFTDSDASRRDRYQDLDSREAWGGICP